MFDLTQIEALIPVDGILTVSFARKDPGVIYVICAPTYMGLDKKNSTVVNVPKPVIAKVSEPLRATERITAIVEETKKRYNAAITAKVKTTPNEQSKRNQLIETRKRLDEEIAALEEQPLPSSCKSSPPDKMNAASRGRKGMEICLSDDEIEMIPRLPEKHRIILQLRVIEKKSAAAAAVALNITKPAVYVRQNAALAKLRQLKAKGGIN